MIAARAYFGCKGMKKIAGSQIFRHTSRNFLLKDHELAVSCAGANLLSVFEVVGAEQRFFGGRR